MKRSVKKTISGFSQKGSVILESMIALLIFSFGILALVALLGASVKNTTNAAYRTEASLLVSQVIGQMWAGDKSAGGLAAYLTGGASYTAWKNKVAEALPGVTASTAPTITLQNNLYTITVFWKLPGETQHKYVAVARISS